MTELLFDVLTLSVNASGVLLVVVMAQTLLKRWLPAGFRHALWGLVGVRLLLPVLPANPLATFWDSPREPLATVLPGLDPLRELDTATLASALPRVAATEPELGLWVLAVLWLGVAAILLVRRVGGHFAVRALVRRARPVESGSMADLLASCRLSMGVRRPVQLLASDEIEGPATYGLLRPVVLIPSDLFEGLEGPRLRHALLHELAHLERRDSFWLGLAQILVALHWFNPLMWWALRRFRTDLEMACDATVLAHLETSERSGYGRTLLDLGVRSVVGAASPCFAVDSKQQLRRRILMISRFRPQSTRRTAILAALAAALVVVTLTDFQSSWASSGDPETLAAEAATVAQELASRLQDPKQHPNQTASWMAAVIEGGSIPSNIGATALREEADRQELAAQPELAEKLNRMADLWLAEGASTAGEVTLDEGVADTIRRLRTAGTTMYRQILEPAFDTSQLDLLEEAGDFDWKDCPTIAYADLVARLGPGVEIPRRDAWGGRLEFCLDTDLGRSPGLIGVRSPGSDGRFDGDTYSVGPFLPSNPGEDIVWIDGYFVRWPQT